MLNYIGSKNKLMKFVAQNILANVSKKDRVFCDLYSGSAAISRNFRNLGFQVIANDLQYYAFVIANAYLIEANDAMKAYMEKKLHQMEPYSGIITEYFSPVGNRNYFTEQNARIIDGMVLGLKELWYRNQISYVMYYHALARIIESADRVANIASVYGAYLKKFKPSSAAHFKLRPLEKMLPNLIPGVVYQLKDTDLLDEISCRILYLDPPYTSRQYGSNYHVLETIACYDNPGFSGVTGLRPYAKSDWCYKSKAAPALREVVRKARTNHIFMSYSSEGILARSEIEAILSERGPVKVYQQHHKTFKADSSRIAKSKVLTEYLFYVNCQ